MIRLGSIVWRHFFFLVEEDVFPTKNHSARSQKGRRSDDHQALVRNLGIGPEQAATAGYGPNDTIYGSSLANSRNTHFHERNTHPGCIQYPTNYERRD